MGYPLGCRSGVIYLLRGLRHDPPIIEQDDTGREAPYIALVGDEHDGLPQFYKLSEQVEHGVGSPGIEVAGRLVSDEEWWVI
jgi:hypothetical protein